MLAPMNKIELNLDVQIFGVPESPLFKQTKIRGFAKIYIKNFGLRLNWIPWTVSNKKVSITFPAFKRKAGEKTKRFPSISFSDRRLGKLVMKATKLKVLLAIEDLEKKANEQKKKKKEEAKKKEKKRKLAELRAFFFLPKEQQEEILWDLWLKSQRAPKRNRRNHKQQGEGDRQIVFAAAQKKFNIWKKNRLKQMQASKESLEKNAV